MSDYQKFLEELHSKFALPNEVITSVVQRATGEKMVSKKRIIAGEINEVYEIKTESGEEKIIRVNRREENPFEKEDWAIKRCLNLGLAVPAVLYIEHFNLDGKDTSVCVQEKISGKPLKELVEDGDLHDEEIKRILEEAGIFLATIHRIKTQGFGPINNNMQGRYQSWEEWMWRIQDDIDGVKKYVCSKFDLDPNLLDKALDIFEKYEPLLMGEEPLLLHSDYHPKHLMVSNKKLSGVIDFGGIKSGSPFFDFAWWSFFEDDPEIFSLERLMSGYTNEKVVNDENFQLKLHYYKLRMGIIMLNYYEMGKNTLGVTHSLKKFKEDLEFFK